MSQDHTTRFPLWFLVDVLAAGAFTTTINVTLLSPLLPHIAADFGVSDASAGQLGTLTAITAGLVALLITPLIDRYSRRLVLQFEAALLFAATLLSVFAPSFALLALSRILAGIGGAIIFGVCLAATADLFTEAPRRNRAIGILSTASTLGVIVGLPVLTQIASRSSWRWALGVLLPLTVIVFAGTFGLPASTPGRAGSIRGSWVNGYRVVIGDRTTLALLGVIVCLAATWFAWLIYFGAFAQTVIGIGAGLLSALVLAGGGAEIVANNAAPSLLQRVPARPLMGVTIAVLGLSLLGIGTVLAEPWSLFLFITIASFTSVLLFLVVSILLLDSIPTARGAVMALQSAGFEAGGALGISGMGLALVVVSDYPAAYRLIGLFALLVLVPVALFAARRRPAAPTPEPGPVTAPL